MTDVVELAAAGRRIAEQAGQQRAAAAKAEAEAAARALAAEQEAEQFRRDAQRTRSEAGRLYMTMLRTMTEEVDQLRRAAEAAVAAGEDPLPPWLKWRLTRAAHMGRWRALGSHYQAAVGRPAPPGAWGPPTSEPGSPGAELPFEKWLKLATVKAERQASGQAQRETAAALHAAGPLPRDPSLMTITPALAQAWLAQSGNPPMDAYRAPALASKMRGGNWRDIDGKPVLRIAGRVVDGVQRLHAVIFSERPGVRMEVANVLDPAGPAKDPEPGA